MEDGGDAEQLVALVGAGGDVVPELAEIFNASPDRGAGDAEPLGKVGPGDAAIAGTGVDFLSVGALTHSARAVDIALDFVVSSTSA